MWLHQLLVLQSSLISLSLDFLIQKIELLEEIRSIDKMVLCPREGDAFLCCWYKSACLQDMVARWSPRNSPPDEHVLANSSSD